MKTNHFKYTLTASFFALMATTSPVQAGEDQVIASFERELNHQQIATPEAVRTAIDGDVLYRGINTPLYSNEIPDSYPQTEQDQVVASFTRELKHESATAAPVTRAELDHDILYSMINIPLQTENPSYESSLLASLEKR